MTSWIDRLFPVDISDIHSLGSFLYRSLGVVLRQFRGVGSLHSQIMDGLTSTYQRKIVFILYSLLFMANKAGTPTLIF